PAAKTKKPSASAAANALPGQQLTPSGKRTNDKYSPARAKQDMQVAHFYYIRQNYRAALSRIQGALRHDPHWPPALYAAGLVETKIGQYAAARRYWADYLRRAPRGKRAKTIREALRKFPPPAAKS
ncbi:MAG: tetratricopeptide repeat protein, partial [Terriglobales bacterium]